MEERAVTRVYPPEVKREHISSSKGTTLAVTVGRDVVGRLHNLVYEEKV